MVIVLALIGIALTASIPVHAHDAPSSPRAAAVVPYGYSVYTHDWMMMGTSSITSERSIRLPRGRVTVLLRTEADTIYAGTESAGLLRSTDDGVTWVSLTGKMGVPMPNLTVTALAEGDSSDVIYAAVGYWLGTSEAHFAPLGVYVSEDGGMSWQAMSGPIPHGSIVAIGVDAEHPGVVYATTESSEDIRYVL
jgi:hypothetical protein